MNSMLACLGVGDSLIAIKAIAFLSLYRPLTAAPFLMREDAPRHVWWDAYIAFFLSESCSGKSLFLNVGVVCRIADFPFRDTFP